MKLADIKPNPKQPRKEFSEEGIKDLAENIKQVGLKQPLIVRPFKDGKYQLVDGERRFRACKLIPLQEVPVEIREDIKTEEDAAIQSYIMNEQRLNYSPQDKEAYIYHLKESTGLSTRKLADKLGVHHSHVDHLLEAYRFRQKLRELAPTLVGTLPLTSSMFKQTAGIKDDKLRISFLKALHDKKIKPDGSLITQAADILSSVPEEAREAFFHKLMTLEDIELYFILDPKHTADLDKKYKEGKISKEEYENTSPVLIPHIKSSEILTKEDKEHFIQAADLIKEERTGIVYISVPDKNKTYKVTFDVQKERQTPEYKAWYARGQNLIDKEYEEKGGIIIAGNALAEWGKACEDGVIQATEDIEDEELRMRTIELVIDYRFAKWVQKAFHPYGEDDEEEETINQ